MTQIDGYRAAIAQLLDWEEAHPSLEKAAKDLPPDLQGQAPAGLPYSPWQLLEHIRLTQHDILDFCRNPGYEEPHWPDDYWPKAATPPAATAWRQSLAGWRDDLKGLQRLATDSSIDLLDRIPHGTGQTYLRELLLVADHTAYHVGELIVVRRLLGAWPPA
jgi:uncharacterized damage-inducible protein DinB